MSWKFLLFLHLAWAAVVATPIDAAQAGPPATVEPEPTALHAPGRQYTQREILAEVVKQTVEQPLHFLMSAGPIWASRWLTAVPWYGWAIVPALAYREWRQWPSKRWWDPPLDALFLVLGALTATWSTRLCPFPLPVPRHRDWPLASWPRA